MSLAPDRVLTINRARGWRELPLGPEDFFLVSRVEALTGTVGPTVAQVIAASGFDSDKAESILERLVGLGLLVVSEPPPDSPRAHPRAAEDPSRDSAPDLRDRARSRRRGMLEAQLRMLQRDGEPERARSSEASSTPTHDESLPTPKPETPASPVQLRSILDTITPVAENDARLEPTIDIPLAQQRRLLAVRDNLRRIEHFELLGLDPIDDPKAIRRAYHIVSRGFHPDTWYGKNIGNFRPVLDDLFRRTRASFELLGDPTRRQALVEAHRSKTHGQQALRSSAEQARALEQREAEKRQAERVEAEARATQAAKEAREARDRERRLRQRDRGSLVREQQGRHYATEAKAAFEAGRFGNAASLYRLAMGMVPDEPKYEQHWRDALEKARHERAESAHGRALEHKAAGRIAEAARCFAEAADAEASLRNATDAAAALGDREPQRARAFALLALEALANAQHRGESPDERTQVRTHLVCARAFLAAGQVHSARQQAERAHAIAPSEQTSALLNTINLA